MEADRIELTIPQPKWTEEYYILCTQIDRHNRSNQANFMIDTKYRTNNWDKWVCLSIFTIIIVDKWYAKFGILGDTNNELENESYEGLAEKTIDNKFDDMYNTKRMIQGMLDDLTELDIRDGSVTSGVGMYLTPRKKRKCVKGVRSNYLQQDWCAGCKGAANSRRYKTTYVSSMCRDEDGFNAVLCYTKTRLFMFSQSYRERAQI